MMSEAGAARLRVFSVFYVSLMAICAELCLSLMVSLKSYSHMVYVVISFALLGYGMGSNAYLLLGSRLQRLGTELLAALSLAGISVLTTLAVHALPGVRINLLLIFDPGAILSLALVYGLVALPFAGIGFLITLQFSSGLRETRRLYFWDLVGAGLGAMVFFPLISSLGPIRSLVLLSLVSLVPAAAYLGIGSRGRRRGMAGLIVLALLESALTWIPEPEYKVDLALGWEYIPLYFHEGQYELTWRTWHPLGRTDLHRIVSPKSREWFQTRGGPITFEIPLVPVPEFSYFTNSYKAGTPVFSLSPENLKKEGCQVKPFSTAVET